MTPEQSRAARGLLGWSVRELAAEAGVGVNTVSRFENSGEALHSTVVKMRAAMEAADAAFIPPGDYRGGGGAGVRLRTEGPSDEV